MVISCVDEDVHAHTHPDRARIRPCSHYITLHTSYIPAGALSMWSFHAQRSVRMQTDVRVHTVGVCAQ